jgi:hypothetical protein
MSPRLKARRGDREPRPGRREARMPIANPGAEPVTNQSLPETVQVLRPPGTWTVPGALVRPMAPAVVAGHRAPCPFAAPLRRRPSRTWPAGPGPPIVCRTCRRHVLRTDRGYHPCMATAPSPPGAERLIRWIMVALVVWGLIHAAGAWTLNHDARRPLVVIACVAGFLGFWLAMLASRRRRLARAFSATSGAAPASPHTPPAGRPGKR